MGNCQVKLHELKDALNFCKAEEKYDEIKKNPKSLLKTIVIESKLLYPAIDPELKHLQTFFELHRNKINLEIAKIYQKIIDGDQIEITQIHFKFYPLRQKQAKYLSLLLPYCTNLSHLNIWHAELGNKGVRYITKVIPCLNTLTELCLEENDIGEEGFDYLAKGLESIRSLKILSITRNRIGLKGSIGLATAIGMLTKLEMIYVDSTQLTNEHLSVLSTGICNLSELRTLGLSFNLFDSYSMPVIKRILDTCKSLTELVLTGNDIGESDLEFLLSEYVNINIRV